MPKIIIYDNSCQIIDEDDDQRIKALDYHLSFRIPGAEHSKAFKGYINERGEEVSWDGRKHLLRSNLKFASGLLDRVKDFYTDKNVEIQIDDQRRNVCKPNPIDILPRLKKIEREPYEYQIDAAEKAVKVNRGIIRAGTGAGKTLISALIAAKLGHSTLILVIGIDLLYQFHKFFSSVFNEPIGIVGDGVCDIHRINISTVWTIGKVLGIDAKIEETQDEKEISAQRRKDVRQMLLDAKTIVIDECHLTACETIQNISQNIKATNIYGLSASPWRDDGLDMLIEAILGRNIVNIPAKYLIENGYLAKPIVRFLSVPKYSGAKSSKYNTVYKKYITDNDERNEMVCKAAQKLVEQGFLVLVLFKTKTHGKLLHKMLSDKIKCNILDGDDSSSVRDQVVDSLRTGKINCIIASTIFDIGIDIVELSALVISSAGKSSTRALQRVGRICRKYPGKTIAPVIDFCDNAPYLYDHSVKRKEILETEFEVQWPKLK